MNPNPILDAALQYAGRGWRVLPLYGLQHGVCTCKLGTRCTSPGKHPCVKMGKAFANASTDRGQIEKWFGKPGRNVGIATGHGLGVVDVDGEQGLATLRGVASSLPRTLVSTTGRGLHLYYAVEGPCPTNSGAGLDIRGDGGMVVAPPSMHLSGKAYAWIEAPLAPIPAELLTFFRSRRGKTSTKLNQGINARLVPDYLQRSASARLADRATAGLEQPAQAADLIAVARTLPNPPPSPQWGWDDWNKYGMAFWASSQGEDYGLEGFCLWSEKSPIFDEDKCLERWENYDKYPPTSIGFNFLAKECREAVPGFKLPSEQLAKELAAQHNVNGTMTALPTAFIAGAIVFPDRDRRGNPKATCSNAYKAIEALGIKVRRDVFHDRTEIEGYAVQANADQQLSDEVVLGIRHAILRQYGFDAFSNNVNDAILWHAGEHSYHPVRDYLAGLEWDRVERIGGWLSQYMGAPATALNAQFGKLILLAAVRRMREPGAKFDEIMVLEGPEGQLKSSAIRILAGADNFADQPILGLPDRMQQEALRGVWLYEIADLTGISRADVDKVKAFASRTEDRARPAYGRHRIDLKRQCVFFGTTNNNRYLQSQTGNRRWWPVECGRIDLQGLQQNRDQLWAEAVVRERSGESIRLDAKYWEPAAQLQGARTELDPWSDVLSEIKGELVGGERRISSMAVFGSLGMTNDKLQMHHYKRLSLIMNKLGWEGPKPLWINEKTTRGYSRAVRPVRPVRKIT